MDYKKVQEIRERAEKVAPGPWEQADESSPFYEGFYAVLCPLKKPANGYTHRVLLRVNLHFPSKNTTAFIAHARQDVPDLCEEVERLQAENAKLRACIEKIEWLPLPELGERYPEPKCPWCDGWELIGHMPDCQRQTTLNTEK